MILIDSRDGSSQGLEDCTAIKQEVQVGSKSNTLRLNN